MSAIDFSFLVAEHDLTNNPNRVVSGEKAGGILRGWAEGMKKKHGKQQRS